MPIGSCEMELQDIIDSYVNEVRSKLKNVAIKGEPEEQLRAPLEQLFKEIAEHLGLTNNPVQVIGETSLSDLKTRPDFAVTRGTSLLIGFVEVKALNKGADPRRFRDKHDKSQWEKLRLLPNLIYTDGQSFSLWHQSELVSLVSLEGDIFESSEPVEANAKLLKLFNDFFLWEPLPPRTARQLAEQSARLCRLLRDEVTEQLTLGNEVLTSLASGWRKMLFPTASDQVFADGYAQAVTFGFLIARARNIQLSKGLNPIVKALGKTDSLIAEALRIIAFNVEGEKTLQTSLKTLTRVLDVVSWNRISKGEPETWLYFYEDFLQEYDNKLRKETGSYYTPPEVVGDMARLVDEVLSSPKRFGLAEGISASDVVIADPAVGTGTFMLGILRRIADRVRENEGEGSVPAAINDALAHIVAFEMQLGPFAVAQLRIIAEIQELTDQLPSQSLRMFVTNTLGDPDIEEETIPGFVKIAESRRQANAVKKKEPITVVIGNPPYKEKAKGDGSWIESDHLSRWMPPKDWDVGTHTKHLRNLYVYFWRWATWKVFDHHENANTGVICYITVAGFLNGPGFQAMRKYLREKANEIWVIDCSPEGHQPDVPTRIFQGVQHPVCIVLVSRNKPNDKKPAVVKFRSLPSGKRDEKFKALSKVKLTGKQWEKCPDEWRAPFLPMAKGMWAMFPTLESLFVYNGSGVMPGRVWIIAPDARSLHDRWDALKSVPQPEQEELFHPHMRNGVPGDKHLKKTVKQGLFGHESRLMSVAKDSDDCVKPIRYAFRSFDRQWIIPDARLINQPNPQLWEWFSPDQIHLTMSKDVCPSAGPAITFSSNLIDLNHYHGRGGRVIPLFQQGDRRYSNVKPALLEFFTNEYGIDITPEDMFAYIAGIAANPAYTEKFQDDLKQPGLRIPITADAELFQKVAEMGRQVIWLQTYGERFVDKAANRPAGPPRLPKAQRPTFPKSGGISPKPEEFPEELSFDGSKNRLIVGTGYIENVTIEMWDYEVSGMNVLNQWFSYRKKDRSRPVIGNRKPPSRLGQIQPDHWIADYTTDLIDLLNVVGMLIELEPEQTQLLEEVCSGDLFTMETLESERAFVSPDYSKVSRRKKGERKLFED